MKLIFLIALSTYITPLTAENDSNIWKLKHDKNGVYVYSRKKEGSKHVVVRGETQVSASLNQLAALLRDPDACSEWADMCEKAFVHTRLSKYESYVYTYKNVPWPIANRDTLTHIVWSQDPQTKVVTMKGHALSGVLEEQKGALRITDANAVWKFKPLEHKRVEITVTAYVDPSGRSPAWLTNKIFEKSLYKTLKKIRRLSEKGRYKNAKVEFIDEKMP